MAYVVDNREKVWHAKPPINHDKRKNFKLASTVPAEYAAMFYELLEVWHSKLLKNQLRQRYYDGKNALKDFGISIPPQLLTVETVVGWPQKAVDALAVRSRFDGYSCDSDELQNQVDEISKRSRLKLKYRQGVQSELIHSCEFAVVGVDDAGNARIDFYNAQDAAAVWDDALGRIAYGMVIEDWFEGQPAVIALYTDDGLMRFVDNGSYFDWSFEPYTMGRPCMDVFAYRPTETRPFGQSRISRAVRSITDSAVRVALGGDVAYSFSVSPQKYLLGADANTFANKPKWEAYIGSIFAVGRDENGDLPQFGQLSQASMQQTVDYFRTLAARFSGETNVPISTLGVIHDQPASAEAIYAANEPLIIECEDLNDNSRSTLSNLAQLAVAAENGVSFDSLDVDIVANFRNPAMPSIVSQTDAMVKIASMVPGFAGTDVFFEQIGFPEDIRKKALNEIERAEASFTLENVLNSERLNTANNEQQSNLEQTAVDTPTLDESVAAPIEEARVLNGAQMQSLLAIIERYRNNEISEGQAAKIISLSCGISEDDARSIVRGK